MVLNLTEEHQHLLRLLGKPYMQFYDVQIFVRITREVRNVG